MNTAEPSSKNLDDIASLRSMLEGTVLLPGDEGFEAAAFSWNVRIVHGPALIVCPKTESDVAHAVAYASRHGLPVAAQTTGHGQPRTCDGGMLINMREIKHVVIDSEQGHARVGGGSKWGPVIEAAAPLGLAPISGSSPGVGVVGYTLGGGYGILSRKHGLGIDNVIQMRVVCPDGSVRVASESENEGLFWALLGGGASYGIVTEITVRLVQLDQFFGGSVLFDASLAKDVYRAYTAWAKTLPIEASSAINLMTFPPVPFIPEFLHGRTMVIVCGSAIADPETAASFFAPIRFLPGAELDSFRPMSYAESADIFRDPVDPLPATGRGVLIHNVDEQFADALLDAIGEPTKSPNLMIQFRQLGGAIAESVGCGKAVGDRRRAEYVLYFLGVPMGPVTVDAMTAHAESAFERLGHYVLSRGPLNWLGEGDVSPDHVRQVYSDEEYAKLHDLKRQIDPNNTFRFAGVGIQ